MFSETFLALRECLVSKNYFFFFLFFCFLSMSSFSVSLEVSPRDCLIDEKVSQLQKTKNYLFFVFIYFFSSDRHSGNRGGRGREAGGSHCG